VGVKHLWCGVFSFTSRRNLSDVTHVCELEETIPRPFRNRDKNLIFSVKHSSKTCRPWLRTGLNSSRKWLVIWSNKIILHNLIMYFLPGNGQIMGYRWLYTFVYSGVIYAVEILICIGLRYTLAHLHFYMKTK